jgi:hypothetical protein
MSVKAEILPVNCPILGSAIEAPNFSPDLTQILAIYIKLGIGVPGVDKPLRTSNLTTLSPSNVTYSGIKIFE